MKRLIMMLLGIFLLAGSAQAVTIEGSFLYGGNGTTFDTWSSNSQAWATYPGVLWELGVSSAPGGPLLNASDNTISGLSFGNYYLYAEATLLGSNPRLDVYLSDTTIISAIFEIAGTNGSGTAWGRMAGDPGITLGWAMGAADLVGGGQNIGPSGANDFYLATGIAPIPEPETYAMLLAGLGLLGFEARRRKLQAA